MLADVNTPSRKPYAGLPQLTYPFHDSDVLVTACGRIYIYRKKINPSIVLAGQRVGIKEVDDAPPAWLQLSLQFNHFTKPTVKDGFEEEGLRDSLSPCPTGATRRACLRGL